ncbi:MAG: GRP family sugar transporter [Clostridia bacterium]|nr:GRP family sugar transporter [Clostridia bacterium]
MWFWLALIALLCWSGSDLFCKIGSKPNDKYSHLKIVMAVGMVMGLHACFEIFVNGVSITFSDIGKYLPVSALYISSMIFGYVALRYIELSISSPIQNTSGALVAILCFFILDERLVGMQWVAVGLVCVGLVALSIVTMRDDDELRQMRQSKANVKYTKSFIALLLPILYCILDAAGTFADSIIIETMDENTANVAYELTFLAMGLVCAVYVLLIKKERIVLKAEYPKVIGAIFETAGQFAYIFALSANSIATAPMVSAYCAVSVLWSRIFLKEKLSYKQYICIGAVIAGIIILGFFEE